MKGACLAAMAFVGVTTSAVAQSTCLMPTQILRWTSLDRKTLIVENIAHQKFRLALFGPCPGIDFNVGAAIKTQGTSSLDCVREGDVVLHRGFGQGNRCPIKSVELYTPAMEKADQASAAAKAQSPQ
jgi:hypothetical protein